MKGIPITDEMKDEIIAMSKVGGFSITDIADETGASATTVSRVLAALDTSALTSEENVRTTLSGDLDAASFVKIARQYENGDPVAEICERNRISIQQMYSVLRESGIPTRAQQQAQARNSRMDDAIRMYENGSPLWEINTATEISTYALNREIHKRGIPLRRPRKLLS